MEKHQLYYSQRDIPLLATEVYDKPILTVENYCKWYNLYLVHPDGKVTIVDEDVILELENKFKLHLHGDHNFHPHLFKLLGEALDVYVHPQSQELAAGRWCIEIMEVSGINL